MKEVKIYSPVDGQLMLIDKSSDEVFAKKMLGDGFVIIPDSNEFYTPFEDSTLEMIFDTKHAFYIKQGSQGPKILVHIGLDTVSLKGGPFDVLEKVGKKLDLNKPFVVVDLDYIKNKGLKIETPLVFDQAENVNWLFEPIVKSKKVKKGELIGVFKNKIQDNIKENMEHINYKNKFQEWAEKIYKSVGTASNFKTHYNCMTRLRFDIIDKKIINYDELKKMSFVKGLNQSGSELQVIIGGDAYRVKEAMDALVDSVKVNRNSPEKYIKKSFKDKTLGFISGVMVPTIPVILAAGLLLGIKAILVQTGAIQNTGPNTSVQDLNWYSGLIYIISEIGIGFLGVFFCVTTVKYLGGNVLVGVLIGLSLASPYIFGWGGWVLFDWGIITIKLQGYFSQIIPQICAGALYVYVDRWIKSWMPSAIDVVFRTGFGYIIVMIATFLVLGPILGIIEGLVGTSVKWMGTLPFGIGTFLFALLWQPLVLTGMHIAVIMSVIANLPSPLYAVVTFSTFGQLGAAIAVAVRTKDSNVRKIIYGTIPSTLLGITEPIIYGITLPRIKPFIAGCIAAGLAGLFTGILGIEGNIAGGMGVLALTRVIPGGPTNIALMVLGMVIATVIAFAFAILISKERWSEQAKSLNTGKKIIKFLSLKHKETFNPEDRENLRKELKLIGEFLDKEKIILIKKCEKQLSIGSKYQTRIETLKENSENKIEALNLKLNKYKAENKLDKMINITKKIEAVKDIEKIEELNSKYKDHKKETNVLLDQLIEMQDAFSEKTTNLLNELAKKYDDNSINNFEANYFNAIHSLDINFGLTNKKSEKYKELIRGV